MFLTIHFIISILLITSLVYATPSDITKKLFRRAGADQNQCSNELWDRQVVKRFNGIFFGDFNSAEFRGIEGPLAVQGDFNGPNYNINTYAPTNCSATNSLMSYAWVLGGNTNSFNVQVFGSAYIAGQNSDLDMIFIVANGPCFVTDQEGTGLFDFDVVRKNREDASIDLANLAPTHVFDENGETTNLQAPENPNYEVFTLMTCEHRSCGNFPFLNSDPRSILFGQGNWTGLHGANLNSNKTVVMNVPVTNGTSLNITTNNPSYGLTTCMLIFNFYPVDEYGHLVSNGTFSLVRETSGDLGGYILAPRGKIYDGQYGAFAGNVVGKEYNVVRNNTNWDLIPEPNIYWYRDPSKCTQFNGCIPVHDISEPEYIFPIGKAVPPRSVTFSSSRSSAVYSSKTFTYDETFRRVKSYTSSETVTFCEPARIESLGSERTVTLPGTTKTVDIPGRDDTVVVIEDKTVVVAPHLRFITEKDTLFQTSTILNGGRIVTETVVSTIPAQCTEAPRLKP